MRSSSSESKSLWFLYIIDLSSFKAFFFNFLWSLLTSTGLHPKIYFNSIDKVFCFHNKIKKYSIIKLPLHPQKLQPLSGNVYFLSYLGTWHKQDFPDFEKARMHSRQHPFFITKLPKSSLSSSNLSLLILGLRLLLLLLFRLRFDSVPGLREWLLLLEFLRLFWLERSENKFSSLSLFAWSSSSLL